MDFFESEAHSPFEDGIDYVFLQLRLHAYEDHPAENYAYLHILASSIPALHDDYPHHPATRAVLSKKVPALVTMLDRFTAAGHLSAHSLADIYEYYTTGWRRQYMPAHSKVPDGYLARMIPQLTKRCERIRKQWPADGLPVETALERITRLVAIAQQSGFVSYQEWNYTLVWLSNIESTLVSSDDNLPALLLETLYFMQYNTSGFSAWCRQYYQQLMEQATTKEARITCLLQIRSQIDLAAFNPAWNKPPCMADSTNPPLREMLEPFFNRHLYLPEIQPGDAGAGTDKLDLGGRNMFEAAVISKIGVRKMNPDKKVPLLQQFTPLCSIYSFNGTPVVNPRTFASYTQPKYYSDKIMDNVITYFSNCLNEAIYLKRNKGIDKEDNQQ